MTDIYQAVESKYGFVIPGEYREMERLGWFDPTDMSKYLWVFEAEWFRPEEILRYEPLEYHKPGFIPFAFTGAGDNWCWHPAEHPVVLCSHDCLEGEIDAPHFLGSIYRRTLEYASGGGPIVDNEAEARAQLEEWASRLRPFFPSTWVETLTRLARSKVVRWERGCDYGYGFLTLDQQEELVRRDLAFPRIGEKFEWMLR
ncbi:MAG TPA: hypothetical protein VEZ90_02490 [Blastocatellia bacterium]|nr:hypothetical protein [Blastocatellia bacterium]